MNSPGVTEPFRGDNNNLLAQSRAALLDSLEALADQRDAVIVIGAQAIYKRTPVAPVALAEATKDSDLALDPCPGMSTQRRPCLDHGILISMRSETSTCARRTPFRLLGRSTSPASRAATAPRRYAERHATMPLSARDARPCRSPCSCLVQTSVELAERSSRARQARPRVVEGSQAQSLTHERRGLIRPQQGWHQHHPLVATARRRLRGPEGSESLPVWKYLAPQR